MSLKSLLAKIGIGKEDGISSGLFIGRTDFHSHILPGVDDGVKTIGESIAISTAMRLWESSECG